MLEKIAGGGNWVTAFNAGRKRVDQSNKQVRLKPKTTTVRF